MFFEDLTRDLASVLEPAAVAVTTIAATGRKDSALAGVDVAIDVDERAKALDVRVGRTFELPVDGVTITAKTNQRGDVSADVEARGTIAGLDVVAEKLTKEMNDATFGAKYALDAIGITADGSIGGGDAIEASAAFAIDDDTAVGAKATVTPSSGAVTEWSLAAHRRDGPTTLSAAVTDGGNTISVGWVSELDANTKAGMETKLQTGGDSAKLSYSLGVAKKLQSGDTMRVVYTSHGDTDVTYTTELCEGATATACLRLASKGHHYKTGFALSMGQ